MFSPQPRWFEGEKSNHNGSEKRGAVVGHDGAMETSQLQQRCGGSDNDAATTKRWQTSQQ